MPIKVNCLACGIEFCSKNSLKGKRKYCSNNCYWSTLKHQIPWNKGKKMPSHCGFQKGHKPFRDKESYQNYNKSFFDSEEYKNKIRHIAKEKGYGLWMIGRKMPDKTRQAILIANKGRRKINPITPESKRIRAGSDHKKWQKSVFERDSYICQHCGIMNKKGLGKTVELNAHHIKSFSKFPELRFDIDNGITLCRECHQKTENWGRPKAA